MPALKSSAGNDDMGLAYQGLALPRLVYEHIKDRPVRIQINYWLTLLRSTTYTMPALHGSFRVPDLGRCRTYMDGDLDEVIVACIQAGQTQHCASVFLEHTPTGTRNPSRFSCSPDYSPYFGQYVPDSMVRFGVAVPFRDPSGLVKYPVGFSQLAQSRVVMRVYRAEDHFTRQLVIPEIRLSDWESVERSN
jgi:hypothetical protein